MTKPKKSKETAELKAESIETGKPELGKPELTEIKTCGIIMPISSIDGCSASHWSEVKSILSDAIGSAGFEANLVSSDEVSGVIHQRIIENLYKNPIVVCDVSAKNPNAMFELGMRLAFDKPTIIVKDDKTAYSFDTGPIEHIEYPRDLRFTKIVEFKEKLSVMIEKTYKASQDPSYTTYLKHFGTFTVPKLETKEVSGEKYIIDELKNINKRIDGLASYSRQEQKYFNDNALNFTARGLSDNVQHGKVTSTLFQDVETKPLGENYILDIPSGIDRALLLKEIDVLLPEDQYHITKNNNQLIIQTRPLSKEVKQSLRDLYTKYRETI